MNMLFENKGKKDNNGNENIPNLLGVGRVLRLHSFRSRATSWVTPGATPVMSSLICWCHVFLGRTRRLVGLPGIARFITLQVTLFASRLCWTCPNQRRRPLCITSSIGVMCSSMRRISSFRMWSRLDTLMIPRSILISVIANFLLLVTFIAQHSLPCVRAGLIMASYNIPSR